MHSQNQQRQSGSKALTPFLSGSSASLKMLHTSLTQNSHFKSVFSSVTTRKVKHTLGVFGMFVFGQIEPVRSPVGSHNNGKKLSHFM